MKKYALIDQKIGDCYEDFYNSENEALISADIAWHNLTRYDRKHRTAFFVAVCECEVDDMGNVYDYEILEIVEEYI